MMSVAIETMRDALADALHQVTIIFCCIAAVHVGEHFIVTSLDRHFDVRHHFRQLCNYIYQRIIHPVRMRGQEADAFQPFEGVEDSAVNLPNLAHPECLCHSGPRSDLRG